MNSDDKFNDPTYELSYDDSGRLVGFTMRCKAKHLQRRTVV